MFQRDACPECGAPPDEPHELFCGKERCPFCGQQLIGCSCMGEVLKLDEGERQAVEEYLDDSREPLKSIIERWKAALSARGRVPW